MLRSYVALGAQGNGPAHRGLIETIQTIEREMEAHAAANHAACNNAPKCPTWSCPPNRFLVKTGGISAEEARRNALLFLARMHCLRARRSI